MDVSKSGVSPPAAVNGSTGPSLPREPGLSSFPIGSVPPDTGGGVTGNRPDIDKAITDIRDRMQDVQRNLNFSVDDSTGEIVVKVIDGESGKVVRQIPSEEVLKLAEQLDSVRSLLFKTQA